jgi:hypothetical protein
MDRLTKKCEVHIHASQVGGCLRYDRCGDVDVGLCCGDETLEYKQGSSVCRHVTSYDLKALESQKKDRKTLHLVGKISDTRIR